MFHSLLIVFGAMAFFAAIEAAFGLYNRPGVLTMRELGATLLSVGTTLVVRAASSAIVLAAVAALWPRSQGALAGMSLWLALPLYLVLDEYSLYWLHRKSHEWQWLWRLHKPHHTPQHMNVAVTYRNNWLFQVLFSGTWLAPIVVWVGQPGAYVAALTLKTLVTFMVHCDLRWDLALQQSRFTRPVMWVLEHIISLPDTHHVHHGVGRHGNAMKNYSSTLVFPDLLHGTLVIPHARQEAFGLPEGAPIEPWAEQVFWPFVRSKKVAERGFAERRLPLDTASPAAALAGARAVIHTTDGRAIMVH